MRTGRLWLLTLLLFPAVALWRVDLAAAALEQTLRAWSAGGPARLKLLGEILLFSFCLGFGFWGGARRWSRESVLLFILGCLAGYAAEAWGTRLGLWRYYTREKPPLWIVPAWPVGALALERAAALARGAWGRNAREKIEARAYFTLAALSAAVCLAFLAPRAAQPAVWPACALLGAAWLLDRRGADAWFLAAGLCFVFFADLWGTTNGCWRYYTHKPLGVWPGVAFGMAFDAAVLLGCAKAARLIDNLGRKAYS